MPWLRINNNQQVEYRPISHCSAHHLDSHLWYLHRAHPICCPIFARCIPDLLGNGHIIWNGFSDLRTVLCRQGSP